MNADVAPMRSRPLNESESLTILRHFVDFRAGLFPDQGVRRTLPSFVDGFFMLTSERQNNSTGYAFARVTEVGTRGGSVMSRAV